MLLCHKPRGTIQDSARFGGLGFNNCAVIQGNMKTSSLASLGMRENLCLPSAVVQVGMFRFSLRVE